jgi:glycosyltransferase involved in cell wall biosynthesis
VKAKLMERRVEWLSGPKTRRRPSPSGANAVSDEENEVKISAVIKARNEADNIKDCIESLKGFADEIIVVDDESKDNTVAIARACGARVVAGNRQPEQRVDTLDITGFRCAHGAWILRIDADERMAPALAKRLKQIEADNRVDGVRFARRNMMFGDWPRYGGWFVADHLRFFRAASWDRSWDAAPHSHPTISGKVISIEATPELSTLHLDYENIPQFVSRTLGGYARSEAEVLLAGGARPSWLRMLLLPLRKGLGKYFIRQGFRDGTRGLILAGLLGCYVFLIEANLWDLHNRRGGN